MREQSVELSSSVLAAVERAIEGCLDLEGLSGSEVSVSIVTDVEMHELNRSYRGVDRTTDVLSFPLEEQRPIAPTLLGDVVISLRRAQEQAEEYGHSLEREMAFLAVHGTLHLMGYDHGTEAEDRDMQERQERVLESLGLGR